jgi:NADPH:quinone reductase
MRAVVVTAPGGPEAFTVVTDAPEPSAGPGQVIVEVSAAGVNFADAHVARGDYLVPTTFPVTPGVEVAGRVATGPRAGNRVVALVGVGGYAQRIAVPEASLVDIPDGVSDADALALILQGLTAHHLLIGCARLAPGESVVVQAAAGGVGTIAVQLARHLGAGRIIGTASGSDRARLVMDLGADAVVAPDPEGLTERLREANGGERIDVVLDMIGGAVTDQCLAALAPFGRQVVFGNASRQPAAPVAPASLMHRSLSLIGFWLASCLSRPATMVLPQLSELLDLVQTGVIRPVTSAPQPMSEVAEVHRALAERRTTGKITLDPSR